MRRARLGWTLASALFALCACNALSGLNEDYVLDRGTALPEEGGSSGSSGSSGQDGAIEQDGTLPDTSTPDTSTPDAGTWCPATAIFCENWDDRTTTWRDENTNGTVTVETGQGVGGSRALHAHINSGAGSRKASRWRELLTSTPTNGRYWLRFAFRLTNNTLDYAVLGALQANNTLNGRTEYGLAAYSGCPTTPCLDETNPAQEGTHTFDTKTDYTLDTWHRAEIAVVRTGAGAYAGTVRIDEGTPVDMGGATYFGNPAEPTLIEVGLGAFFTSDDATPLDVYIDDIAAGKD